MDVPQFCIESLSNEFGLSRQEMAMGYSGREVGQFLNIRSYSAIRISEKGKEILLCREI